MHNLIHFYYQNKKKWAKYADIKEREGLIYVAARMANYFLIIDVEKDINLYLITARYYFSKYIRLVPHKINEFFLWMRSISLM